MSRRDTPQLTKRMLGIKGNRETSAKVALATKLNARIEHRGLSQTEAAAIMGMMHT